MTELQNNNEIPIDTPPNDQAPTQPIPQPNNPLQGITLAKIVTELYDHFGWHELGRHIEIRCFQLDPSIKSSLKFLRRTPWARKRVEDLYLSTFF